MCAADDTGRRPTPASNSMTKPEKSILATSRSPMRAVAKTLKLLLDVSGLEA